MADMSAVPAFVVIDPPAHVITPTPIANIEAAIRFARNEARARRKMVEIFVAGSPDMAASVWPDGKVDAGWGRYVSTTGRPGRGAAE